jgi:hypothetical protein
MPIHFSRSIVDATNIGTERRSDGLLVRHSAPSAILVTSE